MDGAALSIGETNDDTSGSSGDAGRSNQVSTRKDVPDKDRSISSDAISADIFSLSNERDSFSNGTVSEIDLKVSQSRDISQGSSVRPRGGSLPDPCVSTESDVWMPQDGEPSVPLTLPPLPASSPRKSILSKTIPPPRLETDEWLSELQSEEFLTICRKRDSNRKFDDRVRHETDEWNEEVRRREEAALILRQRRRCIASPQPPSASSRPLSPIAPPVYAGGSGQLETASVEFSVIKTPMQRASVVDVSSMNQDFDSSAYNNSKYAVICINIYSVTLRKGLLSMNEIFGNIFDLICISGSKSNCVSISKNNTKLLGTGNLNCVCIIIKEK